MYFRDIIGLEDLKQRLIDNARSGHIAHAQLFCGNEGSGASALALAYARYLNCHNPGETDACGRCASCLKYDRLAHPDLFMLYPYINGTKLSSEDFLPHWRNMLTDKGAYFSRTEWQEEIKAGNSQPIIYSKESRFLDEKLAYKVSEAKYRIIYIWQPEKMHETLANKLLKLVEEPPERTIILMASFDPNHVLGTILSRIQYVNVRPLSDEEIKEGICQRGLLSSSGEEQLQTLAHLAQGSFKHALELIEGNEEAQENFMIIEKILTGIMKPDPKEMRRISEEIAALGRESQIRLVSQLGSFFRECLILPFGQWQLNYLRLDQIGLAREIKGAVNEKNIVSLMAECDLAIRHIKQNVNAKMIFFDFILRITSALTPAFKSLGLRKP